MKTPTDIHATARDWFLAKVVNGSVPQRVHGGALDGLAYYSVVIDETEYWLTDVGLFLPMNEQQI